MISEIKSFEAYESYIREVATESRYSDPHFAYNPQNLYAALKKEHQIGYVVSDGERILGVFVWWILPDERYIEMIIGLSQSLAAIEEMFSFLEERYHGYQVDVVINPQHDLFREALKRRNAWFDRGMQKMVWRERELTEKTGVELLTAPYESQYRAIHNDAVYWTAEKILRAKDKFRVFILPVDEKVVGYLDVTFCYEENEPYCLWVKEEFSHQGYEQALLTEALRLNRPNRMMALVDANAPDEIQPFEDVGFVKVEGQDSVYATFRIE